MPEPKIEVLGVCKVPLTDELLAEAMELKYGYLGASNSRERRAAEEQLKRELSSIVLIEVLAKNLDERFDVGDFAQPHEDQVAYDEAYLSLDGTQVLSRGDPPPDDTQRIVFFLHFCDPERPLKSSYGDMTCPLVQPMPERLAGLVPYQPVS
jgi:hypothetical protein